MTVKTVHALDRWCAAHNMVHYLIDLGKPAQNGTIERSHREDEHKFYQRNTFTSITNLKNKTVCGMSIIMTWNIVDLMGRHLMKYCIGNRHKSVLITASF